MRISDWSSDVCSSDLLLGVSQRQCAKGAAPPFSSRYPRPSQSCAHSDGFGLAPIAPEPFQRGSPRRAAYPRPEREHPSARLRHVHEAHRHCHTFVMLTSLTPIHYMPPLILFLLLFIQ